MDNASLSPPKCFQNGHLFLEFIYCFTECFLLEVFQKWYFIFRVPPTQLPLSLFCLFLMNLFENTFWELDGFV